MEVFGLTLMPLFPGSIVGWIVAIGAGVGIALWVNKKWGK